MHSVDKVWVFAGGDFSASELVDIAGDEADFIVAVDRGLVHCMDVGLQPDLLVGDFDSAPAQLLNDSRILKVKRHTYPSEKASSDLELCLELLESYNPQVVTLFGVSGGRTDHMLFNWQLPLLKQWPFKLCFIDRSTQAYILTAKNNELLLKAQLGATVSLIALSSTDGICTEGLQYALTDATIKPGSTLGLSNVVESPQIRIAMINGTLLVMLQKSLDGIK